MDFVPSQSESAENSQGFDCLCFLNVNEGETLKLCFEQLLKWNRLGREVVRMREPCQY